MNNPTLNKIEVLCLTELLMPQGEHKLASLLRACLPFIESNIYGLYSKRSEEELIEKLNAIMEGAK